MGDDNGTTVGDTTIDSVTLGNYKVTEEMIENVSNSFLDFDPEYFNGRKLYFLAGTYDQIVLENIFNIFLDTIPESVKSELLAKITYLAENLTAKKFNDAIDTLNNMLDGYKDDDVVSKHDGDGGNPALWSFYQSFMSGKDGPLDAISILHSDIENLSSFITAHKFPEAISDILTTKFLAPMKNLYDGLNTILNDKDLCNADVKSTVGDFRAAFARLRDIVKGNNTDGDFLSIEEHKKELGEELARHPDEVDTSRFLDLFFMSTTQQPDASGSFKVITTITRKANGDGTYTYTMVEAEKESSGTDYVLKSKGYQHLAIPYYAVAVMYEKVCIQQLVLTAQIELIERLNNEIAENNRMLKALSWMYSEIYAKCVQTKKNDSSEELIIDNKLNGETTLTELQNHMENKVKNNGFPDVTSSPYHYNGGTFYYRWAWYDKKGDDVKGHSSACDTENVDVEEQATLTYVSNCQDQLRLYGDKLSTDVQTKTAKMQQGLQDSNACVNLCSQAMKSLGEYLKTIRVG
jgi:hypothetical protein